MMTARAVAGFLVLASLLSLGRAARAAPEARPPNIVILLADDMGWGDLACFGHPAVRTPNLDRLAREGMKLTGFYAAPSCTPSRAQLMTGRYAPRLGLNHALLADNPAGLADGEVTLAEALAPLGYRAMMVGKWHLGHTRAEHWPTQQGFERFFGLPYSHDIMKPWVQTDVPLRLYRGREVVEQYPDANTLTARFTSEAVAMIGEAARAEAPFLLYVAWSMPHLPLGASERFRGRSAAGRYGDVIEELDWSVGEIRRALEEAGVGEETLILFTSDNGPWAQLPARMLAGGVERWDHGTAGPFRGSKASTFEGGVRVPAIAWWPGHIPAGSATAEIASVLDVLPTVVKLAGGAPPAAGEIDGVDLSALLLGETQESPRREVFHFAGARLEAVRAGPWKLRIPREGPAELYHLERDPGELYDIAEQEPEVAASLRARMEAMERELRGEGGGPEGEAARE